MNNPKEQEILNERENFRNLFKQTPEMVCILKGPDHVFEFVNEAHIKTLGFDSTGLSVRVAQPESVEVHGILDEVYHTGVTAELSEIPITINDRLRFFNLTYAARRDPQGTVNGVMILGAEVTDQVLARETIQIQKKAFEMALSDSPLESILNTLAESIGNQSGGELCASILLTDSKKVPPTPPLKPFFQKLIYSSNGATLATLNLFSKSSTELLKRDEYLVDLISQSAALVIERRLEIKKRLSIESALRKSEERLSMAISVAKVGFYDWDIKQNLITFSKQMCKDWGVSEKLSLEQAISLIHPDDQQKVQKLIQASMDNKDPYQAEYRVVRPDGETVWIEAKGTVFYDSADEPIRFLGSSLDITERKKVETELKAAKTLAEAANAAKSAFLANMSHEIRTPLGAIMGFSELLSKEDVPPNEFKKYISVIHRNSSQLIRVIDDILDLSKVEAGKIAVENSDIILKDFLMDFGSLMELRAKEKGIEFELKMNEDLPTFISADPIRIKQILFNVVGNAIKFTSKGSVVLEVSAEDNVLCFRVTDTGPGISEETVKGLFKPFSQADSSTSRRFGGSGLGLVLTKKLCETLGGSFDLVKSTPGKGSVFVAKLAYEELKALPESLPTLTEVNLKSMPLKGMKILLVEDSPDNQILLKIILGRLGADVDLAEDGSQGVAKALAHTYEVILMDVQMPKMDGHEATRILRSKGYKKPIVALTAHAMKEERERCLQSGFDHFLSKPIEANPMLHILEEIRPPSLHH